MAFYSETDTAFNLAILRARAEELKHKNITNIKYADDEGCKRIAACKTAFPLLLLHDPELARIYRQHLDNGVRPAAKTGAGLQSRHVSPEIT